MSQDKNPLYDENGMPIKRGIFSHIKRPKKIDEKEDISYDLDDLHEKKVDEYVKSRENKNSEDFIDNIEDEVLRDVKESLDEIENSTDSPINLDKLYELRYFIYFVSLILGIISIVLALVFLSNLKLDEKAKSVFKNVIIINIIFTVVFYLFSFMTGF